MKIENAYIRQFVIYGNQAGVIDDIDEEDNTARVSFNEVDFQWVDIKDLQENGE